MTSKRAKPKQREIIIKKESQTDIYKGLCLIENNECIKEGFGFYFSNFDEKLNDCNMKYFGNWEKDKKEGLGAILNKSKCFIVGNFKENQLSGQGICYYFDEEIPNDLETIKEIFYGTFEEGKPYQGLFYCNQTNNELNKDNNFTLMKLPSYLKEINHFIYFGKLDLDGKKNDLNGFLYDFATGYMTCGNFEKDKIVHCHQISLDKDNNFEIKNVIYVEFFPRTDKIKELWYLKAIEEKTPEKLEKIKNYTKKLIAKYIIDNKFERFLKNESAKVFYEIIKKETNYMGNIEMNLSEFYDQMNEQLEMEAFEA